MTRARTRALTRAVAALKCCSITGAEIRLVARIGIVGMTTACAHSAPPVPAYTPRTRELTVTTVPLLVREQQALFPFLKPAFAKGGVLSGKEVYAFSPSTFTVIEGDTIHFTMINPEDDEHSFVLPDLVVRLPGGTITHATYVARRAGIYPIFCAVSTHLPMMSGQLIVLAPGAVAGVHAGK